MQAIPDLRKQFALTQDETLKGRVASALIRLGAKDSSYWDYLVHGATMAIESDAPSQTRYDAHGKLVPGPSPEFVAWAKTHNLSTQSAIDAAMLLLPSKVAFLSDARDTRAVPLLRKALDSPNFVIQAFAAEGLSQLQDEDSIPLIIAACQRAPSDVARGIALGSLARFDDPLARNAAEAYISRQLIEEVHQESKRIRGGPPAK